MARENEQQLHEYKTEILRSVQEMHRNVESTRRTYTGLAPAIPGPQFAHNIPPILRPQVNVHYSGGGPVVMGPPPPIHYAERGPPLPAPLPNLHYAPPPPNYQFNTPGQPSTFQYAQSGLPQHGQYYVPNQFRTVSPQGQLYQYSENNYNPGSFYVAAPSNRSPYPYSGY